MSGGGGLAFERYRTGNDAEWMMRIGSPGGPAILVLPPLFEELNRTRALLASVMRDLGRRGYRCWLPDLPGCGESMRPLEQCGWADWRAAARDCGRAVAAAAGRYVSVSLRGGCLLDDASGAEAHWRLAPVAGASLARDLVRSALLHVGQTDDQARLAGYPASDDLLASIERAVPEGGPVRTVRLRHDRAPSDGTLPGPPLWRRSEPQNSAELSQAMASDIDEWCRRCADS